MIEVFKTNVEDEPQARILLDRIHSTFKDCQANFDLTDCDKVLRIETHLVPITPALVIALVERAGFLAEVLSDQVPETLEFLR